MAVQQYTVYTIHWGECPHPTGPPGPLLCTVHCALCSVSREVHSAVHNTVDPWASAVHCCAPTCPLGTLSILCYSPTYYVVLPSVVLSCTALCCADLLGYSVFCLASCVGCFEAKY